MSLFLTAAAEVLLFCDDAVVVLLEWLLDNEEIFEFPAIIIFEFEFPAIIFEEVVLLVIDVV